MQRNKRQKLDPAKVAALEAIPRWTWDFREDTLHGAIRKAVQFHAREGHARVPRSHLEDGFRLGQWMGHMLLKYRRGDLTDDIVRALEGIPGWTWDPL